MNVVPRIPDGNSMEGSGPRSRQVSTLPREIAGLMSVLLHLIDQRGPIVVHLTATSPGEGTTTIARELSAAATRWEWCKVALIDANYPSADDFSCGLGLLDVDPDDGNLPFRRRLCDEAVLMEAPLKGINTSVPQIDTLRLLFDRLRKQFTLVIIDSPPVLISQQAAAFAAAADCVVLVVEAERTRAMDLERARATLEQLGARILGVVLNKRRHWVPRFLNRRV